MDSTEVQFCKARFIYLSSLLSPFHLEAISFVSLLPFLAPSNPVTLLGRRQLTRAAVCVINFRAQTFQGTDLLGTR
jgi:hypothetical protein